MKVLHPAKLADANQAQPGFAKLSMREPIEQIDQVHLTKEVVLKPKHDFFVIRTPRQRFLLFAQFSFTLFKADAVSLSQMSGAHVAKFIFREFAGRRTANQGFAPREVFAGNTAIPRGVGG